MHSFTKCLKLIISTMLMYMLFRLVGLVRTKHILMRVKFLPLKHELENEKKTHEISEHPSANLLQHERELIELAERF
jgi:hypothetical protein